MTRTTRPRRPPALQRPPSRRRDHDHAEHTRRRPLPSFKGYTLVRHLLLGERTPRPAHPALLLQPRSRGRRRRRQRGRGDCEGARRAQLPYPGDLPSARPPTPAKAFVEKHGFDFGVVDDTTGEIGRKLRIRQRLLFIGVDREGDIAFVSPGAFPGVPDVAAAAESELRSQLRLPGAETRRARAGQPAARARLQRRAARERRDRAAGVLPRAPGGADLLPAHLPALPRDVEGAKGRPRRESTRPGAPPSCGVSVANRPLAVETSLKGRRSRFLPGRVRPGARRSATTSACLAGVPDTFLIDADGRIARRFRGFDETRDPGPGADVGLPARRGPGSDAAPLDRVQRQRRLRRLSPGRVRDLAAHPTLHRLRHPRASRRRDRRRMYRVSCGRLGGGRRLPARRLRIRPARERRLRELPRPRRPASVAGLRPRKRVRERVQDLSQPDPFPWASSTPNFSRTSPTPPTCTSPS